MKRTITAGPRGHSPELAPAVHWRAASRGDDCVAAGGPGLSESLTKLFIHGRHVDATSDETFPTLNPATGAVISSVQQASVADVDRAVQSATDGFHEWRAMSGAQRGRVLNLAVQMLRQRNDEIAALEVADTGKPISEAIAVDVASGADCIEYFAGAAATIHGDHFDLGASWAYTRREPLGVCGGDGTVISKEVELFTW